MQTDFGGHPMQNRSKFLPFEFRLFLAHRSINTHRIRAFQDSLIFEFLCHLEEKIRFIKRIAALK